MKQKTDNAQIRRLLADRLRGLDDAVAEIMAREFAGQGDAATTKLRKLFEASAREVAEFLDELGG